ncbi:MAG: hypothetical protein JW807_01375 [Spirochaetes bacterium]|nr:hypothetical protein [Spirochaetota bacterium]
MDKSRIDKTKHNIGVQKLDEKTRKNLFEKFVEGGGKVIDEKTLRRNIAISREKQKELSRRDLKAERNKRIAREQQSSDERRVYRNVKADEQSDISAFALMLWKLKIRIKMKFLGITGLGGYFFSGRFFKKFNNAYKPALMDIQILFLEIFRKNPAVGRNITAKLDDIKPLYYELIEMVGNLFDKIEVDQIMDNYVNFPDLPKKIVDLKEQILGLYRKLYVLNAFENSILLAYEQAITIYLRVEENAADSRFTLSRRMRTSVFVIFHKLFPRLHMLFCMYQGRPYDVYDPDIEGILGVTEAEKPGNRQLAKYFEEAAALQEEQVKAEIAEEIVEPDVETAKAIRQGLEMMAVLDMNRLRKEYDKSRLFERVSDADKVFITYLLFNEFDREYSFIMTTNKIKFRTDFVARTKIDFKARLIDLYDKMRKSSDSLKEYAEELMNYDKVRREKPTSSSQYIEYTKRMEVVERKKDSIGKNALAEVRDYMIGIAQELKVLLNDMDGAQIYIENPQEALVFDSLIEGEKKINGKKIYEALYVVYCYAMAFAHRLGDAGDLSGALEFKKEELDQMQKDMKERAGARQESEEQQKKSVLEELDDMI